MISLLSKAGHSLLPRLAALLLSLGALVAVVLLISWLVFQTIQDNMATLKTERVPQLRASASVISATDATRTLLQSALSLQNVDEIEAQFEIAERTFADFRTSLELISPAERARLLPMVDQTEAAVTALLTARSKELKEAAGMVDIVRTASKHAEAASALIEEANDAAIFDMTLNGEDAIGSIDETLTRLVDENFVQYQQALGIRSDINLITGLAIAFNQNDASPISTIVEDLSRSALDRLSQALQENQNAPAFAAALPVLQQSLQVFERVFQNRRNRPSASEILEARLSVDAVLSPTLDDIYFEFVIANDDAKATNRATLEQLLEVDVEKMQANAGLDAATKAFFAVLLQVSMARSDADLGVRQTEFFNLGEAITRLKAGTAFENQTDLTALITLADPTTGVAAKRATLLEAQGEAATAAEDAGHAVEAITREATLYSEGALTAIEDAAAFLSNNVDEALMQLISVALIALLMVLIVPVLIWLLVTRPIGKVTQVTERLAGGDLSEIKGLPRNQGELGRLANALQIFRDNALKNIAMQEEERKREREAAQAEKDAEDRKRAEEQRRISEEEERLKAKREEEEKLAKEAEERRRNELAERTARMEEQSLIVSTLAQSLKSLSEGDLTCKIDRVFPEAYEALRLDFNSAIAKLSETVGRLKDSASNIEDSCSELSSASTDLARRTESSASTLAKTVVSVGNLSSSVKEASNNAGEASATIQSVREQANVNNDVMEKANLAMSRVDEASSKITSIVSVIDSIAFQTNLLALNAGVEAARAGDAGQGFSVVASEVRALAQRCSEAASEIGHVVDESAQAIREGVEFTEKANEAMSVVSEGIDQISKVVDGIAEASVEQAQGLGDVDLAIQNLDKSTQQNAAMFEETSASNRVLSTEAYALSDVVRSFVIEPNADAAVKEVDLASRSSVSHHWSADINANFELRANATYPDDLDLKSDVLRNLREEEQRTLCRNCQSQGRTATSQPPNQ